MRLNSSKNILIVGSGGREHALGWKLKQSHEQVKLFFAPGNGGTAMIGTNTNISSTDVKGIVDFVKKFNIDATIIGPETALEAGVSDALLEVGHDVFGPTKKAAQLETSKAFAAEFMVAHNIPHPEAWIFTDAKSVIEYIGKINFPIVIKASSIAGGKGVFLPDTDEEAARIFHAIENGTISNVKNDKIIIQKRLYGREASILAFSDGKTVVPLIPAQDHKRAYDNDKGPNTGGMGTFAPSLIDTDLLAEISETILQPTIDGMAKIGLHYKGVLYAGLMLTEDGPKVIEYNARFGDPETQPLMMMLSTDLLLILSACIHGNLSTDLVKFRTGASVCVVIAEKGYPDTYVIGHEIRGLENIEELKDVEVFHAGTKQDASRVMTNGGRVLGITAYGKDIEDARKKVYSAIGTKGVGFEGMEYRTDIGLT